MYRFYIKNLSALPRPIKKLLLIMKLTTFILTISILHLSANTLAQKITLSEKNTPLVKVFERISMQSGYDFLFSTPTLSHAKNVTIQVNNADLKTVLEMIFYNQPLEYSLEDKSVVVAEKAGSEPDKALDYVLGLFRNINVSGRVTDEQGNSLSGTTITVKGTNHSVISGKDGSFILRNVEETASIVVSYLGYETREIGVKTDLGDIRMMEAKNQLQEVTVNTGYQSLPKERATGSFATISKDQIDKPSNNIAQRLIGMVAGVQATLDAEGNPKFEIRGQTSLNVDNAAPLVVVDGFAIQGDFNTINPNDVETITILKDAAAASIWGAKSANGVIVIITKRAKKSEALKVSFSAFTKIGAKLDLDYVNPLASSSQTVDYEIKSFGKWGAPNNPGSLENYYFQSSPATVALNEFRLGNITAEQRDNLLNTYRNQSNKGQISDELLNNPINQQYNLSLSGGNQKMTNNMSLLYEDNKTNFKGTNNKKYTFNYRTSADVFKWLEFNFSGQVNYNKLNNNGVTLEDIQNISPYEMLRNPDGSFTNISQYYSPVIDKYVPKSLFPYNDWGYNPIQEYQNRSLSSEQMNTRLQAGLKFKILPGLSFETKGQYELLNVTNKNYFNENTYKVRNTLNTAASWDPSTNTVVQNLPKGGILDQSRSKGETYNFRNQVNYSKKFNEKHEINFVAGTEINTIVTQTFGVPTTYGYNEETLSVGAFPNGAGGLYPITDWMGNDEDFNSYNTFSYSTERYFSLFGNAAYTYNDKYTFSASARTDASNLITDDPSYRYAPFWSAGLGWQISKEQFMHNITWLDKLSLRGTFGYNGNVDRSTSFRPLIGYNLNPNRYTGDRTASVYSFGNPTLRWEKTSTMNLGADFSMFAGKLFGKIDVYNKSGKDLIADLSIPSVNGTTFQRLNNARMTNKGIEIELGTFQNIVGSDITWQGNVNFSYNKNKVTKLFVATYDAYSMVLGGSYAYVEGENSNSAYRYRYAGVVNGSPMVYGPNNALYNFTSFIPGNGRDFLENMGTLVAPYTLGFSNSFKVYDFNLSFILTGKFGHVFQRKGFNYPANFTTRVLPNNKIDEAYNGDPSKMVPLPGNDNEPKYYFWDRFTQNMDYLIESANHIRMQEISVGYNLPARIAGRLNMSRFQVFAQGNNVFTIVSNSAGEDPEYPLGTVKPQPKLTLGLKCEF